MPEWSNGAVSKTVVLSRAPGVRIPLSPQSHVQPACRNSGLCFIRPSVKLAFKGGVEKHYRITLGVIRVVSVLQGPPHRDHERSE